MTEPTTQTGLWRLLNLLIDKLLGRWLDRAERSQADRRQRDRLKPLSVADGDQLRYFTWRGRGDVHLVGTETEPRQLLDSYVAICAAIRQEGAEPQFDRPTDLTGEIVYELSEDFRAKWRVLGGAGGGPGTAVLVVRPGSGVQ